MKSIWFIVCSAVLAAVIVNGMFLQDRLAAFEGTQPPAPMPESWKAKLKPEAEDDKPVGYVLASSMPGPGPEGHGSSTCMWLLSNNRNEKFERTEWLLVLVPRGWDCGFPLKTPNTQYTVTRKGDTEVTIKHYERSVDAKVLLRESYPENGK